MQYLFNKEEYQELLNLREQIEELQERGRRNFQAAQPQYHVVATELPEPDFYVQRMRGSTIASKVAAAINKVDNTGRAGLAAAAVSAYPHPAKTKLPLICPKHHKLEIGHFERGKFFYACDRCREEQQVSGAPDTTAVTVPTDPEEYLDRVLAAVFEFNGAGKISWALVKQELRDLRAPVPMLIFCPRCSRQHIDEPDPSKCGSCGHSDGAHAAGTATSRCQAFDCMCNKFEPWNNPEHRSHYCGNCGLKFRLCDRATEGVRFIETAGSADDVKFTKEGAGI